MAKIVALIDGSIYSQSVCDHAAWFAKKTSTPTARTSVEIVHVLGRRNVSSEPANLSGSIGLGARSALLDELAEHDANAARLAKKRGRIILEDAKDRVVEDGVSEVSTRLRHAELIETVQEFEQQAELIIIGKHGEAADFDKLHLGSNLERVVRFSHRPVLVASRAFKPIEKFLIAFDGGDSSVKAVEHIARRHAFSDIPCQLLYVGIVNPDAERKLQAAAKLLADAAYTVDIEILPGQPEAVITEKAEAGAIDLIVMGAYGHSRIRNLIIGSTTTEMIRSCKTAVMLFR